MDVLDWLSMHFGIVKKSVSSFSLFVLFVLFSIFLLLLLLLLYFAIPLFLYN